MSEGEVFSPPFPSEAANPAAVLNSLSKLREWILEHREWANNVARDMGFDGEVLPDNTKMTKIPELNTYLMIAVPDMYRAWIAVRTVRESWDLIIRTYEDSWESKKAILKRISLLHSSYLLLRQAFVTFEMREAEQDKMSRQVQSVQKSLFRKLGVPEDLLTGGVGMTSGPGMVGFGLSPADKDEIDFDSLFNPPSEGMDDDHTT